MRARIMSDVEFCRNCLKLIDEVHETRRSIIITRNGVPLVRVVPAGPKPAPKKLVKKDSATVVRSGQSRRKKIGPRKKSLSVAEERSAAS